jgi:CheY-like chemotaxis protein
MSDIKVLLVDDDEIVRTMLTCVLEQSGFVVKSVASVPEALRHIISSETYNVLVSDLHMPGAGDGLTVISAMRHANPLAVTILISSHPEMTAATQAIVLQTDEILLKPLDISSLGDVIKRRILMGPPAKAGQQAREFERVEAILARTMESVAQDWFARVQAEEQTSSIPLAYEQRTGHIPVIFQEIISRLSSSRPMNRKESSYSGAGKHGVDRLRQGYTLAMLVEEYRLLQLSIFKILRNNLAAIDYSLLLNGVMTIADEINSQLAHALAGYSAESMQLVVQLRECAPQNGEHHLNA